MLLETELIGLSGTPEQGLQGVRWLNRATGEETTRPICHVFLFVGAEPETTWLEGCGIDCERGFVKTGALLAASIQLGAACGRSLSAEDRGLLDRFARAVGLAFQVVDDVLDVEADSATLGKTAGKDSEQNKPTYVSVLGLSAARALAQSLRDEAHTALAGLGPAASRLAAISDLIVQRSS